MGTPGKLEDGRAHGPAVPVGNRSHGVTGVAQQMPAIRRLDRRVGCRRHRHRPVADNHPNPGGQGSQSATASALRSGSRPTTRSRGSSEDPTRARGSGAAKAMGVKIGPTGPALPAKISGMPDVSAMDAARIAALQGAGCRGGASPNRHEQMIRVDDGPLNSKAGGE